MFIINESFQVKILKNDNWGHSLLITIKGKTFVLCFCHHMPERSIKFLGIEKYLCARCFGVLIGGFIGLIFLTIHIHMPLIIAIILLIPLLLDGTIQALTDYTSCNKKRFITGFFSGVAIVYLGMYFKYFLFS